jgi:hypothetical protein
MIIISQFLDVGLCLVRLTHIKAGAKLEQED